MFNPTSHIKESREVKVICRPCTDLAEHTVLLKTCPHRSEVNWSDIQRRAKRVLAGLPEPERGAQRLT
jgi:ribosomal protein L44E